MEHTPPVTFVSTNTCAKTESDLFDGDFFFEMQQPGTFSYGSTAIAKSKGCCQNDHDPPLPQHYQPATYLSIAPLPP